MRKLLLFALVLASVSCVGRGGSSNTDDIKSVVILGNSIVRHAPSSEIGWEVDWGMAASAAENDFVHLLEGKIHEADPTVEVTWENIAPWERNYTDYDFTQFETHSGKDMIIIKLSENVAQTEEMEEAFISSYDKLVRTLDPENKAYIVVVEGFWPSTVNNMLKKYAEQNDYPLVALADLFDDKSNTAIGLFEHEGVANHPSDKGMANIADRIWSKISDKF